MKTSCDSCGSSDAKHVYDDHTYCFSCNEWTGEGSMSTTTPTPPAADADGFADFHRHNAVDMPSRRLTAETLRKFRAGVTDDTPTLQVCDGVNSAGQRVSQKVRTHDKQFWVVGSDKDALLFGEHLWESGGKRLVITEGEIDAMSYAQATGCSWPVVSVWHGAPGAAKDISRRIEFVDSFDEVVFLFDNDQPGEDGARECAALLTPGKAKLASLPLKDASDMLRAGRGEELRKAVWNAKSFRPDGIYEGADISIDQLMEKVSPGYATPYPELNAKIRGIRPRSLLMLTAGSGIGKSTLARELVYHNTVTHGLKTGLIMLEESMVVSAQSMVAIDNNVPLGDLMVNPDLLPREQWEESKARVVDPNAFYDSWGSSEIDHLLAKCRYFAIGCGCQFIILDHISMVVSGLETNDERKTLDLLMTKLRGLVEQTGVGVIGIVHLKRNNSKDSFNEGAKVSITDLRGSAAIEQLSDCIVAAERDQQSEEDANVVSFRVLKNRAFGATGPAGKARYDSDTGRLLPYDETFTSDNPTDVPDNWDDNIPF